MNVTALMGRCCAALTMIRNKNFDELMAAKEQQFAKAARHVRKFAGATPHGRKIFGDKRCYDWLI